MGVRWKALEQTAARQRNARSGIEKETEAPAIQRSLNPWMAASGQWNGLGTLYSTMCDTARAGDDKAFLRIIDDYLIGPPGPFPAAAHLCSLAYRNYFFPRCKKALLVESETTMEPN